MQCEHRLWREGRLRECERRVGVHTWYDARGVIHAACSDHIAARLHLYPEADPPEPAWLHERDAIDEYKSWTDAGWSESELREAWGR